MWHLLTIALWALAVDVGMTYGRLDVMVTLIVLVLGAFLMGLVEMGEEMERGE